MGARSWRIRPSTPWIWPSGALIAVTVQPADRGDTSSYSRDAGGSASAKPSKAHPLGIEEVVMDKGYHSGAVLVDLAAREIRSYVPEQERGKRHWSGKRTRTTTACTRTGSGCGRERSKRLQKLRGELCERSFAQGPLADQVRQHPATGEL